MYKFLALPIIAKQNLMMWSLRKGQLKFDLGFHRPEFSDISETFIEMPALNLKAN